MTTRAQRKREAKHDRKQARKIERIITRWRRDGHKRQLLDMAGMDLTDVEVRIRAALSSSEQVYDPTRNTGRLKP